MGVDDYNETMRRIQRPFLDAIEGMDQESPINVVYAGVGLLVRLAHDCAPNEEAAQKLIEIATECGWEDVHA